MKTTRLTLFIGLIGLLCSNAFSAEGQPRKLYVEGVFKVQSNMYVPAVRDYHRIILQMETDRGKFFYFNLRKDLKEQKQFSEGNTYRMRIEVTDIYLIEKENQFEMYTHPKDRRGYVIIGSVNSMEKISVNKRITRDSQ